MKAVNAAALFTAPRTLGTLVAVLSLCTACASGGDDPDDGESGGNGSGGSGTTGGSSSGGDGTSGSASGGSGTSGSASGGSGTSGSASAGNGGAAGGSSAASVCDDALIPLPVGEEYVDNFESDTRFAGWYAFSDTDPPNMPGPERVEGGALETEYAVHITATGISNATDSYGAGFGFGLVDPAKGKCVDLTAFDGISFWVKGTAGADDKLKFQIVSPATQPSDSEPPGDCVPMTACAYKHPAKDVALTEEWTHVVIKWSDLAPAAAYTGKVLGFNMVTPGPAYDVYIDEVTFFSGDAPTGPVAPAEAM